MYILTKIFQISQNFPKFSEICPDYGRGAPPLKLFLWSRVSCRVKLVTSKKSPFDFIFTSYIRSVRSVSKRGTLQILWVWSKCQETWEALGTGEGGAGRVWSVWSLIYDQKTWLSVPAPLSKADWSVRSVLHAPVLLGISYLPLMFEVSEMSWDVG